MKAMEIVGILFVALSCFIIAINMLTFNFLGICLGIFSLGMWIMIINDDRRKERLKKKLIEEYSKKIKRSKKDAKNEQAVV